MDQAINGRMKHNKLSQQTAQDGPFTIAREAMASMAKTEKQHRA